MPTNLVSANCFEATQDGVGYRYSPVNVLLIWAANNIKPHLSPNFKLPNDPHFQEKIWDVIGLYLSLLEKTLVLCCLLLDQHGQPQMAATSALVDQFCIGANTPGWGGGQDGC